MYNPDLEKIKDKHNAVIQKIEKLESDQQLKEVLKDIADIALSSANTSLFAVGQLSKKIGSF